jgi:hypothetical protein
MGLGKRHAASLNKAVMPGLVPGIHVVRHLRLVDGRAYAAPKGLRPRRRVKPSHDGGERGALTHRPH